MYIPLSCGQLFKQGVCTSDKSTRQKLEKEAPRGGGVGGGAHNITQPTQRDKTSKNAHRVFQPNNFPLVILVSEPPDAIHNFHERSSLSPWRPSVTVSAVAGGAKKCVNIRKKKTFAYRVKNRLRAVIWKSPGNTEFPICYDK
jgi:hypothetical protein